MLFGPLCYKLFTKNSSSPYKGTFFTYLVHIFRFFHKDFILPSLLYSQTLFCHLAHFSRNFRKKIIPYHISERFSAIWSASYELSAKNISTPNIDIFFAFGPPSSNIFFTIQLEWYRCFGPLYQTKFNISLFLPWRCGYSRIAQTKRQRTKTFGFIS